MRQETSQDRQPSLSNHLPYSLISLRHVQRRPGAQDIWKAGHASTNGRRFLTIRLPWRVNKAGHDSIFWPHWKIKKKQSRWISLVNRRHHQLSLCLPLRLGRTKCRWGALSKQSPCEDKELRNDYYRYHLNVSEKCATSFYKLLRTPVEDV